MKRLLDVGNCEPDHSALCATVNANFEVEVVRAHGLLDATQHLADGAFDLVTINRIMDRDGTSGLDILSSIKNNPKTAKTPVMLITNFADVQQQAQSLGAVQGFGKKSMDAPATVELLRPFL